MPFFLFLRFSYARLLPCPCPTPAFVLVLPERPQPSSLPPPLSPFTPLFFFPLFSTLPPCFHAANQGNDHEFFLRSLPPWNGLERKKEKEMTRRCLSKEDGGIGFRVFGNFSSLSIFFFSFFKSRERERERSRSWRDFIENRYNSRTKVAECRGLKSSSSSSSSSDFRSPIVLRTTFHPLPHFSSFARWEHLSTTSHGHDTRDSD